MDQTSSNKTLITGATGYVGKRLAAAMVARGRQVVLPVRAASEADFHARREALINHLIGTRGDLHRDQIQVLRCDISDPAQVSALPHDCATIIHAAAVTRFNVEAAVADRHNREASRHIFELARRSPQLAQLAYVSTIFAAGEQSGPLAETLYTPRPTFANHYERSKWETEQLLALEYRDLPWNIMRVATIIADDESGGFTQLNVVHNTLKLLYYGLISIVPGDASVPLYLVCGDFVEAGLLACIDAKAKHAVYHIAHERGESLLLGAFIDLAFHAFSADPGFKKRGVAKPLLVDDTAFRILADGVAGFGGAVVIEALGSMTPFARQLFIDKEFSNAALRAVMPSYRAPDNAAVIAHLIPKLVAQRWVVSRGE